MVSRFRPFLAVLLGLALAASAGSALAAPSAADIDAALIGLSPSDRAEVDRAGDALRHAEDELFNRRGELAAARLREKAAQYRLDAARAEVRAVEESVNAAVAQRDEGAREVAVVGGMHARGVFDWRSLQLVAAEAEIRWRQHRVDQGETWVALHRAELWRAKVRAVRQSRPPALEFDLAVGKATRDVTRARRIDRLARERLAPRATEWLEAVEVAWSAVPPAPPAAPEVAYQGHLEQLRGEVRDVRRRAMALEDELVDIRLALEAAQIGEAGQLARIAELEAIVRAGGIALEERGDDLE